MTSPHASPSSYKNLKMKHKVSIKEKMRQDYRNKILDCRDKLINRLRGPALEEELRDTLNDIYKNIVPTLNLEAEITELDEIQSELVQEELQWWLAEYEKSQMETIDWSAMEKNNDIICPLCQKVNLSLEQGVLKCSKCVCAVKTALPVSEIKKIIFNAIDKHSSVCDRDVQFSLLQEGDEKHIFILCYQCSEMQMLV